MKARLIQMLGLRCPEYVWPEMRSPFCRCTGVRGHRGAHRDPSGDAWEGRRR